MSSGLDIPVPPWLAATPMILKRVPLILTVCPTGSTPPLAGSPKMSMALWDPSTATRAALSVWVSEKNEPFAISMLWTVA